MKRLGLLASASAVYLLAAWMVAPGFYDGFTPLQPYNWVCPPPQAGSNQQPNSGHQVIKVVGGVSDAAAAYTVDIEPQVVLGFNFGVFDSTGKTSITVDIKPVSPCPKPSGITLGTNTYLITADAPLVKKASLVMRFSDLIPAPSTVYYAASPDGPWTSIGALSQAQPFTIDTTIDKFGYFAAGYPSSAVSRSAGGSSQQLLPIALAVLIIAVILAGIPLAILRRRRVPDDGDEDDSEP